MAKINFCNVDVKLSWPHVGLPVSSKMQVQYGTFEHKNSFCMQKAYTGNACGPIHLNVYLLKKIINQNSKTRWLTKDV